MNTINNSSNRDSRVIAIASGKGGTGKTSIAVNLSLALAASGKKTTVVDGDVTMASTGIMLGLKRSPITIHNVLMGECTVAEATYDIARGLKVVPAGLSLERIKRLDFDKFKTAITELKQSNDFVIIDCAPGLEKDAMAALTSAEEVILVLNPEPTSLADALKVKALAERNGVKLSGVITNMRMGEKTEIRNEELEKLLGCRVVASIPFDPHAKKASTSQTPAFTKFPKSDFTAGITQAMTFLITGKVTGKAKKGIVRKIFESISTMFKK
ncbi:MAG: cell division ATPase MinD [Candidatus Micrarchaeota archaeon]